MRRPNPPVLAALALAAAGLLAGCAAGPDFQPPAPPPADGYTREPLAPTATAPTPGGDGQRFLLGLPPDRQWWTRFGSAPLDALVAQAVAHNPSLDVARAALRQAHENTAAQYGLYFPTVTANYSKSVDRTSNALSPVVSNNDSIYSLHTAQLLVAFAPDVFGLNRRTVESLRAQEDNQRDQLDAAYTSLIANVVQAAVQEASLRAQIGATEQIIALNRQSLRIVENQFRLGAASGLDLGLQRSSLAQAQQTLPPLYKQLAQSRDLLAALAGQGPADAPAPGLDLDTLKLPTDIPVSLPSQLVRFRPDVRAAEAQVHVASALVGVAVANRLPQFPITGALGSMALTFGQLFNAGNIFWSLVGGVTQPVFDAGTLKHRALAAQAGLDEAEANYRSVALGAFQNVADGLYALQTDAQALSAGLAFETAASRNLFITQGQLRLGAVNPLALLTAQQTLLQARTARIQAQAARYADTAALFLALGGEYPPGAPTAAGVVTTPTPTDPLPPGPTLATAPAAGAAPAPPGG